MAEVRIEQVHHVPLSEVEPWPGNPRQGDVGALSESLRIHGQYRPLVVQASSSRIIAGNHTWAAAKALGWEMIAITRIDVDDEQAQRILLVDNRLSDLAVYDDAALSDLLTELAVAGGLDGTGYDGDALDELLADLNTDFAAHGGAVPAIERREQFDSSPIRQIVLIVDIETFTTTLDILARLRSVEGHDTNTEAILSLLHAWRDANPDT